MSQTAGIMKRKVDTTLMACEAFLETLSAFTVKIADEDDILIDETEFVGHIYKDEHREKQKQEAIRFVRKMFDKLGIVRVVNYIKQCEDTVYVAAQKASHRNGNYINEIYWFEIKKIADE